jgi:hypothetical protein
LFALKKIKSKRTAEDGNSVCFSGVFLWIGEEKHKIESSIREVSYSRVLI